MKKTYKLIAISALALAIALPAMAQTDDGNVSIDTDTSVNTNTSVDISNQTPPPQTEGDHGQNGPGIRARIRADINSRVTNAENNQGIRNTMLEHRMGTSTMMQDDMDMASGTPRFGDDERRGPRPFMASSTMMGSTTRMYGRSDNQGDNEDNNGRDNHVAMFEERKRIVTQQFDVALNNLSNISSRLGSRIQKEQATGRDMSTASSSLVSANAKIQVALDAVTALKAYLPTASSTVTASTTINLDTARSLASTAQEDIKAAQKALNDVVVAIAHSMGLKLGQDDQVEATSTASTTSQ